MKRYRAVFLALILPFIAFAEPTPFTEKESAVHAAATDAGPAGNSASGRVQNLEAERIIELEPLQTVIAVRSNVQGAAVYLNREYQGVTPLTVSGLTPGVYELHVEKTGFTDCTYLIYLSEGRSFSYFVPLERNVGFLDLSALPPDAEVFVDSRHVYRKRRRLAPRTRAEVRLQRCLRQDFPPRPHSQKPFGQHDAG